MSKLAIYIDFSIKIKIIFGNMDIFPIKLLIWKYYIRSIMYDKLKILIMKNIHRCSDCGRADWAFFAGENQKFYGVDACSKGFLNNTEAPCCMKYICLRNQCRLKCVCERCNNLEYITQPNSLNDIGWNALEGKQSIKYNCSKCGENNIRKLMWNHNCIESSFKEKLG